MARKGQATIQDSVETDEELDAYLEAHKDQLICMEVYSNFCGPCVATSFAIRKGKMEIGQDAIAMVKASANGITRLERFKDKSEPTFLFIVDGSLTRAMFGSNGVQLCTIIEEELAHLKVEQETGIKRPKMEISELLPEEKIKLAEILKVEEEYRANVDRLRVLTLAARKRRVNDRLSKNLRRLNFILFWPLHHQAHFDLYEKWDMINVSVAAKEEVQLDEKLVTEVLYMSDVEPNEACVHALITGKALAVLFKMMESDTRDFVKLMRQALYEDIPIPKEDTPPEKQLPPIPAYERYASISKTAREVRRDRYNEKLAKLAKEKEERDRLAAEQARLIREAEEEAQRIAKQKADEEKMARIAAGLPAEPEPEEVEGEQGEEALEEEEQPVEDVEKLKDEVKEEQEEVFHSDVEIEGEDFIPAGGLFVPGLYTPANELAKANGLTALFPKQVKATVEEAKAALETEFLPPHVLVIFPIDKRHDVMEIVQQYRPEILQIGVFVGDDPYNAEHVAFTVKQYDTMVRLRKHLDRLAVMVSRKRSLPLLQLAGLNPCYISADIESGEKECLSLFPVGYGDEYEEVVSVVEEEEEVAVDLGPTAEVEQKQSATEPDAKDEEDEEED